MPAHVVSANDVGNGKPDPEGYRAAHRLGVDAGDTIVLEDADAGIEAGLASGATVVVVGTHAGAAARGLISVRDLRELSVEQNPDGSLTLRARPGARHSAGVESASGG